VHSDGAVKWAAELQHKFTKTRCIQINTKKSLALRRIFGPKRDEVTGERRKLHSEELHNM
jgi:hypothetical protein